MMEKRDFSYKHQRAFLFLMAIVLTVSANAEAQSVKGARSVAMGQTGAAIPVNEWAVFSNVALIQSERKSISFYGFRYAGFAEITDMAANIVIPRHFGTIAAGFHRYGFDLFNENQIRLSWKNSYELFHYGLSLHYLHIAQGGNYGSAGAFGVDIGIAAMIGTKLIIGSRATNINQPSYGKSDEQLPRELAIGFSYQPVPQLLITADLVKDVLFPLCVRTGFEFEIIDSLFTRAGISTAPQTWSLGFGYITDAFSADIAIQNHEILGISPALGLTVKL
jgi:hypothetical protein